ncbi:1,4-dihydroxy-6-naphthoate synthase [Leptospira idonii]|uniref:1,4-dihydroxy-6-naphtoate synthase n=1 Tax=Leptospira idonii TaxID=1193500 RepID=A0A4R9M1L5_9LEPT|nr:1,4-dihydroxy-6-naphthoate synthase [Leptospira idonii]TGN19725.1 menaquinone biosynthesis protein [Leptospira idonii]
MISIAYSPCPNDTFLFYHLIRANEDKTHPVTEELWDVENLNEFAKLGKYPVTKLSFAAYFSVLEKYILLETGSALGRGCGPLVVRKKGNKTELKQNSDILVPGQLTTANLLLSLYTNGTQKSHPLRYDKIIPSLLNGDADLGVIIHEERFTYEERGLEKVVDLGEWWEEVTKLPIPLGAIAIRRDIPREDSIYFQNQLRKSLDLAYTEPKEMFDYIRENSQNKEDSVIRSHIDLYVNDFTKNLGEEGHKAIHLLYEKAIQAGFLPPNKMNLPLFLGER